MSQSNQKLTFFEASSIIAGLGIGGGIMAIPYLASLNGLVSLIIIMIASYIVSLLLHLVIADIVISDEGRHQLVEIFGKYLLTIRINTMFTWIFFVLIVINFLMVLTAYIVGYSEILLALFGLPVLFGKICTYLISAGIVFLVSRLLGKVKNMHSSEYQY